MQEKETETTPMMEPQVSPAGLRKLLNALLFDIHTGRGKIVYGMMLVIIILAVLISMLGTVASINTQWGHQINTLEHWVLMIFATEYVCRVYSARHRWQYISSFYGIIDLATVLPLFIFGDSFVLLRLLRLARVIRVAISFPVVRLLFASLKGSTQMLLGVLASIGLISVLVGNSIYILEPQTFANAFEGAWWSLVTMSTVGYGDFVPQSALGKTLAAVLILSGICMFAMVTAVISVKVGRMINHMNRCESCNQTLPSDYAYCPHCASPQSQSEAESLIPEAPDTEYR